MSFQATTSVIQHSKHSGSELLCLIMMANHAHGDGTNIFPSIRTLARECRMSDRGIQYIVARLLASGELKQTGVTESGTKIYRVTLPLAQPPAYQHDQGGGASSSPGGCKPCTGGVQQLLHRGGATAIAPKQLLEQSKKKEEDAYRQKKIPTDAYGTTLMVERWRVTECYRMNDTVYFGDGMEWRNPPEMVRNNAPVRE